MRNRPDLFMHPPPVTTSKIPTRITLPTVITLARIALAPAVAWALMTGHTTLAAWCFIAGSLSDWLDGYLARKWNQITRLGALLDPIADKLMTFCSVLSLVWIGLIPAGLAIVLIGRDILIMAAAVSAWRVTGTLEFPPSLLGKLHTFVAFTLMAVLFAHAANWIPLDEHLPYVFIVPVVTAVLSAIHYLWGFSRGRNRPAAV